MTWSSIRDDHIGLLLTVMLSAASPWLTLAIFYGVFTIYPFIWYLAIVIVPLGILSSFALSTVVAVCFKRFIWSYVAWAISIAALVYRVSLLL